MDLILKCLGDAAVLVALAGLVGLHFQRSAAVVAWLATGAAPRGLDVPPDRLHVDPSVIPQRSVATTVESPPIVVERQRRQDWREHWYTAPLVQVPATLDWIC